MAAFHRSDSGVAHITLSWLELARYSKNSSPVCDHCLKSLVGYAEITLVPILNEALCAKCAEEYLQRARPHPEDANIEAMRVQFYKDYFGLEEAT